VPSRYTSIHRIRLTNRPTIQVPPHLSHIPSSCSRVFLQPCSPHPTDKHITNSISRSLISRPESLLLRTPTKSNPTQAFSSTSRPRVTVRHMQARSPPARLCHAGASGMNRSRTRLITGNYFQGIDAEMVHLTTFCVCWHRRIGYVIGTELLGP
jgi:hypothetical protein